MIKVNILELAVIQRLHSQTLVVGSVSLGIMIEVHLGSKVIQRLNAETGVSVFLGLLRSLISKCWEQDLSLFVDIFRV